jgi:hypothetical protein
MKIVSDVSKEKDLVVVKVNPVEFGLKENQAEAVEKAFKPMLETMTALGKEVIVIREKIAGDEITKEIAKEAGALLSKYVKARTGTAKIHTEQKAFARQFGLFVDGYKNAQLMAGHGIEEELKGIRDFRKIAEAKIISDNQEERSNILLELDPEIFIPSNLGEMDSDAWDIHLLGTKSALKIKADAAIKLEEEAAETKRLLDLKDSRIKECSLYAVFIPGFNDIDFGSISDSDYDLLFSDAVNEKTSKDEEAAQAAEEAAAAEKILTDKADLFVKALLKDGYTKERVGYVKSSISVSIDSLKALNKREFKDLVGKNNTFIQTETNNFVLKCWNEADEINLLFNLEVEADKENITKTQKKAELENKKAEELAAALAPDKEKVIKFTADILNNIAEYQITIKDEDIKKLLIKSITILTDELNYLKAVVDK